MKKKTSNKFWQQPIDRVAIALMLALGVIISFLVLVVEPTGPHVRDFSWSGKTIGANDTGFLMTFSRPMDRDSVENNLKIDPFLPGKFSWAGLRMAYTLTYPAPYGAQYQVSLEGARERFQEEDYQGKPLQPFTGNFITRDRAIAYIGVEGDEIGRLVLFDLTKQQKSVLTPPNLVVTEFIPYPNREKILFAAADPTTEQEGLQEEKLYTVTTGINYQSSDKEINHDLAGKIELILDNQDYQNLKFDLSRDGKTIVVRRVNRNNPAEFGLWFIKENAEPQPLNNQPGGDFIIVPDSKSIAIAQGEGVAILPLEADAKPIDFLSQYGRVLAFSRDGRAAAMVNFNTQDPELRYQRSIYLVTNQGTEKKVLDTNGSILDCQFDPSATNLFCLLTDLTTETNLYIEQPYLAVINLQTNQLIRLAKLPQQIDLQMSLAPDGLGILLDRVIPNPDPSAPGGILRTNSGESIATSKLWLLLLSSPQSPDPATARLEELPLPGWNPRWLP
ncbi:hypothetical protein [Oscillatoria salina]|uniref:hypothetical protein n=1 Tax=Oscillatoria salina TaxID=331517 RepID=UPI0013BE2BD0|nr:hypothetical protein [Oscillatoria salina]MBZ8182349.1 hypothetical protein [Oscillatoria salina IIICB1]NET87922.1 hypothetical protein [Kamptonema sp. SIO1D9]